jgi:GlpG protein
MIGHLPAEDGARAFSDYLYGRGIDNQVEPERDGRWAVWVHGEDQMAEAEAMLRHYRDHSGDPEYAAAAGKASERRLREERENESARKRFHDSRRIFPGGIRGIGFLTAVLVGLSVATSLVSSFGDNEKPILWMFISDFDVEGGALARLKGLPEIRHGEVWRLFTPMFIHLSVLHLFVNMLWLLDLGTMIERRQSAGLLAALVLVIAALSNLGQYFWHGPSFGGMSGVVYGLIGYIWLRGKWDPGSGLSLHSSTVSMAMIWFVLCLVGVIPNVANGAHSVGLVVGVAWGYVSALLASGRR